MNAALTHKDILSVRDASRRMVRQLGFMRPTLAETDLSASAVHAIIELGTYEGLTANQLGQTLLLEKSSVSRMLGRLVERGLVAESASDADGRSKILSLTPAGRTLFAAIEHYANHQVGRALHALSGDVRSQVVNGLSAYAEALRLAGGLAPDDMRAGIEVSAGFQPGAIGRIAEMHGRYYAREWGFPPIFEVKIAAGVAEFVPRLERPANQIWLATQAGQIKGSIAVDGEDLGDGKAHIRWVILEPDLHGTGTGRKLVTEAMKFCDEHGFSETHLWTFKGLNAARTLYESVGFELAEEWHGTQWGFDLPEQQFVRRKQ
jgi:DNA-binding MarR family transcriptional regulator/N-acetylglutamate synthase-like GNAT family acetyltransferase